MEENFNNKDINYVFHFFLSGNYVYFIMLSVFPMFLYAWKPAHKSWGVGPQNKFDNVKNVLDWWYKHLQMCSWKKKVMVWINQQTTSQKEHFLKNIWLVQEHICKRLNPIFFMTLSQNIMTSTFLISKFQALKIR